MSTPVVFGISLNTNAKLMTDKSKLYIVFWNIWVLLALNTRFVTSNHMLYVLLLIWYPAEKITERGFCSQKDLRTIYVKATQLAHLKGNFH